MTVPNTAEFAGIRNLRMPPYNPLNPIDACVKLAQPCEKCGASEGQACLEPCHRPTPIGPAIIRIDPGDQYDPNPDIHPEPARPDMRRHSL